MNVDRRHRATGELALHVLEVLATIADSTEQSGFRVPESTVDRSEPLPADWRPQARTLDGRTAVS